MRVKVYVIELSPGGKRTLVVGAAVVLLLATALRADANVPNTFTTGEVLSAAQMNANFANIDSWLTHPVVTKNGAQFSLGAIYCGLTPSTTGQVAGGYAGVKSMCETACGSTSAHICTGTEIVATLEAGVTIPFAQDAGSSTGVGWYTGFPGECQDWTTTNNQVAAAACWNNGAACFDGNGAQCNDSLPVVCCD